MLDRSRSYEALTTPDMRGREDRASVGRLRIVAVLSAASAVLVLASADPSAGAVARRPAASVPAKASYPNSDPASAVPVQPVAAASTSVASLAGSVLHFGVASDYGSMAGRDLSAPIVGMAATGDGGGYWLVGSDGGVSGLVMRGSWVRWPAMT